MDPVFLAWTIFILGGVILGAILVLVFNALVEAFNSIKDLNITLSDLDFTDDDC